MRISLLFLGKTKSPYLGAGIDDFCKRLRHHAEIDLVILKEVKPAGKPDAQIKKEDGKLLLAHLVHKDFVLALDPGGKQITSEQLAETLEHWRDNGISQIKIVIGGALGLSDEVLARANLTISLSRMTFTHEMARLIIVEQIYRAYNILTGTGYHK